MPNLLNDTNKFYLILLQDTNIILKRFGLNIFRNNAVW